AARRRHRIVDEDTGDRGPEAAREVRAPGIGDGGVEGGETAAQRAERAVFGEQLDGLRGLPRQQLLRLARAGADQRRAGTAGRQQADAMAPPPKAGHRAAQQQHVTERARADEEDVQGYGTSTRAVATLPRRSVARTTTTCGPGGARSGRATS